MSFKEQMRRTTVEMWSAVLRPKISWWLRFLISFVVCSLTISIAYFVFQSTGSYFSSIAMLGIVILSILNDFLWAMAWTFALELVAELTMIPPYGQFFVTPQHFEHFFILSVVATVGSAFMYSLRISFQEAETARHEALLTKESLQITNASLSASESQFKDLNSDLEIHISNRTQQLTEAIDKQKAISEILKTKQKELQAILDYSPAAISLQDSAGRYVMVNIRFCAMIGLASGEVLGKTNFQLYPEEIARELAQVDERVWLSKRPESREREIASSGIRLLTSIFPVLDDQGNVHLVGRISTDVTSVRKFELAKATLEMEAQSAKEASRLKSEFLANMSHEIRTPINGITGMARLLAETKLNHEQKSFVEAILSSSSGLLAIVNDILDFSKVEAGKLELEEVPFDLSDLVNDVKRSFMPQAAVKGLELIVRTSIEGDPFYQGDPGRIRQILNNLISNAVKFTDQGRVEFDVTTKTVKDQHQQIRFRVIDTGPGLSEDVQKRLFQKFSQGDSSTSRKYGGSGLGLAISKNLAHLMGGMVGLRSEVGRGSEFFFEVELPTVSASRYHERKSKTANLMATSARQSERVHKRILVADDNHVNLEITCRMLKKAGYKYATAANGLEVLSSMEKFKFDLILMDCQMPELDGFEATARIRASGNAIPIIAVTANAYKSDADRCFEAQMNDYLAKPLNAEDLIAKIDHALFKVVEVTPAIIDRAVLRRLDILDDQVAGETAAISLKLFLQDLPKGLGALQASLKSGDVTAIRKSAHAIKSGAANLGAVRMTSLLQEIEDGLISAKEPDLYARVEHEAEAARLELSRLIAER